MSVAQGNAGVPVTLPHTVRSGLTARILICVNSLRRVLY